MPMKYKTQCICQHPDWNDNKLYHEYHDRYDAKEHDENKDIERELSYVFDYSEVDGDFTDVIVWTENEDDLTDIEEYHDDIWVHFNCSCGDEISFSEGGIRICECGRVYKLSISLRKNDTHKGDMEYWDKIKASKYKRFGDENDND